MPDIFLGKIAYRGIYPEFIEIRKIFKFMQFMKFTEG